MKRLTSIIEYLLTSFFAALAAIVRAVAAPRDNIVVLKHFGGIGDYVLLTASFPGYREIFPNNRILLLVRDRVEGLARFNPYVDEVVSVNMEAFPRSARERLRVWNILAHRRIETFVNTDYSTHYETLDTIVTRWSGAARRIAFQCLDRDAKRNYALYSDVVPQTVHWMFEADRDNEMLHYLGLRSYVNRRTAIPGLDSYKSESDLVQSILRLGYYVVVPGAGAPGRCWPTEKYASLIGQLRSYGLTAVLCGGNADRPLAEAIMKAAPGDAIDATGKTTLMDLALLIQQARFMVSNETGAVHIGAAVETPSFVVLGGGHFGRFVPYPDNPFVIPVITTHFLECFNCDWHCKYDSLKCIDDISVDQMLAKIHTYLEKNPTRSDRRRSN